MKFPTNQGVREVQGRKALARSCYADYLKNSQEKHGHKVMTVNTDLNPPLSSQGIIRPRDEVEKVAPRPEHLEKKLRVRKYLESGIKNELITFLSKILDIFAWSQADMIRIDLELTCHRLNIDSKEKNQ